MISGQKIDLYLTNSADKKYESTKLGRDKAPNQTDYLFYSDRLHILLQLAALLGVEGYTNTNIESRFKELASDKGQLKVVEKDVASQSVKHLRLFEEVVRAFEMQKEKGAEEAEKLTEYTPINAEFKSFKKTETLTLTAIEKCFASALAMLRAGWQTGSSVDNPKSGKSWSVFVEERTNLAADRHDATLFNSDLVTLATSLAVWLTENVQPLKEKFSRIKQANQNQTWLQEWGNFRELGAISEVAIHEHRYELIEVIEEILKEIEAAKPKDTAGGGEGETEEAGGDGETPTEEQPAQPNQRQAIRAFIQRQILPKMLREIQLEAGQELDETATLEALTSWALSSEWRDRLFPSELLSLMAADSGVEEWIAQFEDHWRTQFGETEVRRLLDEQLIWREKAEVPEERPTETAVVRETIPTPETIAAAQVKQFVEKARGDKGRAQLLVNEHHWVFGQVKFQLFARFGIDELDNDLPGKERALVAEILDRVSRDTLLLLGSKSNEELAALLANAVGRQRLVEQILLEKFAVGTDLNQKLRQLYVMHSTHLKEVDQAQHEAFVEELGYPPEEKDPIFVEPVDPEKKAREGLRALAGPYGAFVVEAVQKNEVLLDAVGLAYGEKHLADKLKQIEAKNSAMDVALQLSQTDIMLLFFGEISNPNVQKFVQENEQQIRQLMGMYLSVKVADLVLITNGGIRFGLLPSTDREELGQIGERPRTKSDHSLAGGLTTVLSHANMTAEQGPERVAVATSSSAATTDIFFNDFLRRFHRIWVLLPYDTRAAIYQAAGLEIREEPDGSIRFDEIAIRRSLSKLEQILRQQRPELADLFSREDVFKYLQLAKQFQQSGELRIDLIRQILSSAPALGEGLGVQLIALNRALRAEAYLAQLIHQYQQNGWNISGEEMEGWFYQVDYLEQFIAHQKNSLNRLPEEYRLLIGAYLSRLESELIANRASLKDLRQKVVTQTSEELPEAPVDAQLKTLEQEIVFNELVEIEPIIEAAAVGSVDAGALAEVAAPLELVRAAETAAAVGEAAGVPVPQALAENQPANKFKNALVSAAQTSRKIKQLAENAKMLASLATGAGAIAAVAQKLLMDEEFRQRVAQVLAAIATQVAVFLSQIVSALSTVAGIAGGLLGAGVGLAVGGPVGAVIGFGGGALLGSQVFGGKSAVVGAKEAISSVGRSVGLGSSGGASPGDGSVAQPTSFSGAGAGKPLYSMASPQAGQLASTGIQATTSTGTIATTGSAAPATAAASAGTASGVFSAALGSALALTALAPAAAVASIFFITIYTLVVIFSAFLTPLPIGDSFAPVIRENKYMELEKTASLRKMANGDTKAVTFTITVKPKSSFQLKLVSISDSFSFQPSKAGVTNPTIDPSGPYISTTDFPETISRSEKFNFTVTLAGGTDVMATNTVAINFDAYDAAGEIVKSGESLTATADVIIGNPDIWCWPTSGTIKQLPGGSYSHNDGRFFDAYDIAPGASGYPIYAPVSGLLSSHPYQNNGYGNYLTLEFTNPNSGATEKLLFGHLSKSLVTGSKIPVTRGQKIGLVGSTGRSDGPHLHYELVTSTKAGLGSGIFANFLPKVPTMGERVTTCY